VDQDDVHVLIIDNLPVGTGEDLGNVLKTKGDLSSSEESEKWVPVSNSGR
jgi:hypothetical protein